MTQILSDSFFGNKLLLRTHYQSITKQIDINLLKHIFTAWINNMTEGNEQLQQILLEFLILNINQAIKLRLNFQKFSSFIQLSTQVFQDSFKNHLKKNESLALFRDVIVRHSLFRPPYSVKVFDIEDVKQLTKFWVQTFDRYFDLYDCCFGNDLDEQIVSFRHPHTIPEKQLQKPIELTEELIERLSLK